MSNPKQIHKEAFGGERALLRLGHFPLRRQRRATSFNGSLECARDRRLRPRRRPAAGAEQQHDELPVRTTAVGQLAYDRPTTSIL